MWKVAGCSGEDTAVLCLGSPAVLQISGSQAAARQQEAAGDRAVNPQHLSDPSFSYIYYLRADNYVY